MKNEDMGVLSWGEEIQNSEFGIQRCGGKEYSKVLKKIAEN